TTNAIGLDHRAARLRAAGLDRINVSLDSVVSETFERLSRRPLLHRVLAGIDGARTAGLDPIKINAVLLPGVNDQELPDLLDWCLERDLQLRVIEQMPLDADHIWDRSSMITAGDMHEMLAPRYALTPVAEAREGAPAELFEVADRATGRHRGRVGVIASVTRPFCGGCRRTRLTAVWRAAQRAAETARPGAARIAVRLFGGAAAAFGADATTVHAAALEEVIAVLRRDGSAEAGRVIDRSSFLVNAVACTDRARMLAD